MAPLQALPAFIAPWMARQRWYANKGALPVLEPIGSVELPTDEPDVRLITHLLLDHTVGKPALYQVPLSYRGARSGAEGSLVGESDGWWVYDAPHDPAYTRALLALVVEQQELDGDRMWARGSRAAGGVASDLDHRGMVSRVLTGEQSNTSIVFEGAAGPPVIVKLFRALHHGENPDVELQTALAAAGSDAVPRSVGHVVADWSDTGETSGRAHGHLAFAQEFLPGAQDAWRVALSAAAAGRDFSAEAHALGVATAGVHAALAVALPRAATEQVDIDAVVDHMHGRLATAISEVPQLEQIADAIRERFELATTVAWPDQQRIHGDLHLGQVLAVPGRAWVIVDFEGEPLRPMRERSQLDNPMRDVAGMLRSFDYVAGSLAIDGFVAATDDWVATARAAFTLGYSEASGCDIQANRALVDAFELDKALYETVYEVRNRPAWLPIPLLALRRLSERRT